MHKDVKRKWTGCRECVRYSFSLKISLLRADSVKNDVEYSKVIMDIFKLQKEKLVINPDNPDLCQEVMQFLSDCDSHIENIPVTIFVNPPIRTIIEDADTLSEILIELSDAYRTEGNYFLELHMSNNGIVITFCIGHTGTTFSHETGSC